MLSSVQLVYCVVAAAQCFCCKRFPELCHKKSQTDRFIELCNTVSYIINLMDWISFLRCTYIHVLHMFYNNELKLWKNWIVYNSVTECMTLHFDSVLDEKYWHTATQTTFLMRSYCYKPMKNPKYQHILTSHHLYSNMASCVGELI